MSWLTTTPRGVIITVHATPRASRTALQGLHGAALKIRLQAAPAQGQANAALVRFLAQRLGLATRQITLLSGAGGRRKRLLISGREAAAIAAALLPEQARSTEP